MRDCGCDVVRIQELGMAGASDAAVYRQAQENEAVLVTTDQGFGDVRTYPPSEHHGIIVLKTGYLSLCVSQQKKGRLPRRGRYTD